MDIDKILQKFGVFSGLSGDALTACLPYCQDAMAELTANSCYQYIHSFHPCQTSFLFPYIFW